MSQLLTCKRKKSVRASHIAAANALSTLCLEMNAGATTRILSTQASVYAKCADAKKLSEDMYLRRVLMSIRNDVKVLG